MDVKTDDIWEEFSGALRRFILSRVRDEYVADDILLEAFYKIHKNIDKLKDTSKLRSWLYQITRNSIIDYYRIHRSTADLPEVFDDILEEPKSDSDVEYDLAPCVRSLMDRLPDQYKQSLLMTEFEDLSQKELGVQLDLSLSGAKSRVQRARGKMKDLLLDCCRFEFDRRGNIFEYQPKSPDSPECCKEKGSCASDRIDD